MTDQDIEHIIEKLNRCNADEDIFIRPLSVTVDLGMVWCSINSLRNKSMSLDGPHSFYFIKNIEGTYIGTVYNMDGDLHWLVLPHHRGKGLLTNALSKTILPHIFQDNREEQRITIDREKIGDINYIASLKVALSIGFTIKKNNT